ncbi:hypothetical protein Tco_0792344 [Tanacetum coccineum]
MALAVAPATALFRVAACCQVCIVTEVHGVQYEARITEPIIGSVIDRSRRPRDTHSLVDLSINCLAAVAILGTDSHGNNSQSFEVARSKITKIPLLGGL